MLKLIPFFSTDAPHRGFIWLDNLALLDWFSKFFRKFTALFRKSSTWTVSDSKFLNKKIEQNASITATQYVIKSWWSSFSTNLVNCTWNKTWKICLPFEYVRKGRAETWRCLGGRERNFSWKKGNDLDWWRCKILAETIGRQ